MEESHDKSTQANPQQEDSEEKMHETTEQAEDVVNVSAPKSRGKRSKAGPKKPKTPIVKRPFKKISDEVLQSRIADMSKKLDFMTEKMTQLRKRFDLHEHEQEMRQNAANSVN